MLLTDIYGFQWRLALLVAASLVQPIGQHVAEATRMRYQPNTVPISQQIYNNYRLVISDPTLFQMEAAGLLDEREHLRPYHRSDELEPSGRDYASASFKFNATEYLRKVLSVKWFVPLEERVALQVYDSQREMDLAAGTQVNQSWCGLHLDYMLQQVKRSNSDLEHATDRTLFDIMLSYDEPRLGLNLGNNIFPGDYHSCLNSKMALFKQDLVQIDSTAANEYFSQPDEDNLEESKQENMFQYALSVLGPFVGLAKPAYSVPLNKKYKLNLRHLPMRYCFLSMRWPTWPNSSFHQRNMALRSAVCIPDTCDSNSLKLYYSKIKQLADSQMSPFFRGYYIQQLYCLPDEQSQLRNPLNYTSTVFFFTFNLFWIWLTLLATLIKSMRSASLQHKLRQSSPSYPEQSQQPVDSAEVNLWSLLSCWCITKNIKDFITSKRSRLEPDASAAAAEAKSCRNLVDLSPIEGLKVVSAISTITSHALMVALSNTWNPRLGHHLLSRSPLAAFNVICPSVVNIFFVVTGVITTRMLLKGPREQLSKFSFWLSFFVYRYIRIMPLYLFVSWFLKSSFRFIGSGPFWDYGTSHSAHSKLCQDESWWTLLLNLTNFKSPSATCNGVGWYLANDMQYAFLTPFFIITYLKWPTKSLPLSAAVVLSGIANHVRYYYLSEADIRGWFEWSLMILTRVTDDNIEGYVYPQYRFVSYIIGLAAGQILYEYEIGQRKGWPRVFTTYGKYMVFVTIYLLCFIPYITSLVPLDDDQSIRCLAALLSGTLHGITSIAAAMFVLLLCTNHLPWISWLYTMRFLKPLADASLSTLLVHLPLLAYHSHTIRRLPELSLYYFITTNFIWCTEAILLSIVVHIVYERPMKRFLVKLLFTLFANNKSNEVEKSKLN